MKQAIRLYGHERPLAHDGLDVYRCSQCSIRFEMEQTAVGPRCCPACGVIYELSHEQLTAQLARCAMALNMDPTTLLWIIQAGIAGLRGGSVL